MKLKFRLAALAMAVATCVLVLGAAPGHGERQQGDHGPGDRLRRHLRQTCDSEQSCHPLVLAGTGEYSRVFAPTGPAPKKGQRYTFKTSSGKLRVRITAAPTTTQHISLKSCHFSYAINLVFSVVGSKSTGSFARTSGPGAVEVYYAGYGPRYKSGPKKGQCNTSPNAPERAKGAVATFLLSVVLKL